MTSITPSKPPKVISTSKMSFLCLLALGILAVLAAVDFNLVRERMSSSRYDSSLLHLSAKQRVLFERCSLLARYFISAPDNAEKEKTRNQLLNCTYNLEKAMDHILHGNAEWDVPNNTPAEIQKIYRDRPVFLEMRVNRYLNALKSLALSRNIEVSPKDERFSYIRNVASGKLLAILDQITSLYQERSDRRLQGMMKMERGIFTVSLLIIAAIWFFIFLPMIREARRKMTQLNFMNQSLENANVQLENLTKIDPLTGALNRRGLQEVLTRETSWTKREGWMTHALLVDLDNFKSVNDVMGYAIGDIVITEVARRLKRSLRITDYLARIGGDEFVILLPKTNQGEAVAVAQKVRLALSENVIELVGGRSPRITASVGIARVDHQTLTLDALLARIYPTLKHSKQTGKNRVSVVFDQSGLPHQAESSVAEKLSGGDSFYAVKQAIMDLEKDKVVAYEVLSRCGIHSYESPDLFFRVALENNLLTTVDCHCLKTCGALAEESSEKIRWHYNLFPSTLLNIPVDDLLAVLPNHDSRRKHCIEISESQIIGDPSYLAVQIRDLKKAGVTIAIDDVGFGRSCLENLILLEPQIIKIDKRCVQGVAGQPDRARTLKRLLAIVRSLKTEVIAEGIENEADLEILRDFGVRYGQGYLFGKPA